MGGNVATKFYDKWSHTDPILEGPMGGEHQLHKDVFDVVIKWTQSKTNEDSICNGNSHTKIKGGVDNNNNDNNSSANTNFDTKRHEKLKNTLAFDTNHPACSRMCPDA